MVSSYNGTALTAGRRLVVALAGLGSEGVVVMGGVLNEDRGGELPVDVRVDLETLGIRCPERLSEVPGIVAAAVS